MAETTQTVYKKGKLYDLALTDLQPDPDQPRKYFDELALAELSASIVKHGVLEPVLFRQGADGGLLMVSGERRFLASKLAGCETIPAIFTKGEPAEISIVENLLRENLTAIEEAEAIERLKTLHDYTLAALGATLGKGESTLSEILSLNRLPAAVKDDCRNDPKTARGILVVIAAEKTPEKMTALYAKYKDSGLTRGEIRKRSSFHKGQDAPVDLSFVDNFHERLNKIDSNKLSTEQKAALNVSLVKLCDSIYQHIKSLN